ncbi:hypothetical protein JOD43_001911 [Pullulanibacillus pueri]|uniref:TATA-box binding n=1 Tax=Pullulanibacillus pueri TaxID=1437324 RepID=A0A8J3EMV2_9BACL|nr:YwmB family TATA-box binding protein [Pullulanibacillus pueri]MBM7681739.1 hypothetical protein [Pullulanibacillus pueri]GGH84101.1 hypothetical protein GCM10007096_26400 [Pullulanibacillus pueri]
MRQSFTHKILIFVFLFTFFIGAYAHAHSQSYTLQMRKLPAIIGALHKENVSVNSWSVYGRENSETFLDKSEFYSKAATLKQQFSEFHWKDIEVQNEQQLKFTGTFNGEKYQETVTLFAYPYKNGFKTYFIYEAVGKHWDGKKWESISSDIDERLRAIFQNKNGKIFVWASGALDGKMDVGMTAKAQEFLSDLNAHEIEKIDDKTFVSLSAYNKHWKELIQTNGNKMNVQVGLRKAHEQTTVTIGTPIITTEY